MKTIKVCEIRLKTIGILFFILQIILTGNVFGQQGESKNKQPDVKIDLKREYDENGNVKSYDSVYSFSWTYEGGGNIDSVLKGMREQFGISPFGFDEPFLSPFDRSDEFQNG